MVTQIEALAMKAKRKPRSNRVASDAGLGVAVKGWLIVFVAAFTAVVGGIYGGLLFVRFIGFVLKNFQ